MMQVAPRIFLVPMQAPANGAGKAPARGQVTCA